MALGHASWSPPFSFDLAVDSPCLGRGDVDSDINADVLATRGRAGAQC